MARRRQPRDDTAAVLAIIVTIGVAAALVGIRGEVDNSVTVLVLAAVVSACGLLGGWRAGATGAIAAALSFNFFHTEPYLSLRIHDADDVLTTFVLLGVGLMGGVAGAAVTRRGSAVAEADVEVGAIDRIVRLVTEGTDPEDVEVAVRAELLEVLRLSDCRFVLHDPEGMTELGRGGALGEAVSVYHDGGFELPSKGVVIPVSALGTPRGYLVCVPVPGIALSVARRRTAVALAGLLGAAFAVADRSSGSSRN